MNIPPERRITHQTLRNLVLDSPAFAGYDPYFAEFVLRQGVNELTTLIQEMLGEAPLILTRFQDENQQVAGMTRYIGPVSTTMSQLGQDASPQVPLLLMSDTMLATLLFITDSQVNDAFKLLYQHAFEYIPQLWQTVFRQFIALDQDVRDFGQNIHALFGEGRVPTREQANHYATELTDTVYSRFMPPVRLSDLGTKCQSPSATPQAADIFRPESLN